MYDGRDMEETMEDKIRVILEEVSEEVIEGSIEAP